MSFRTVYGYDRSENHWRMCDRNECDIPKIPNLLLTDTAPLRKGAPLTILGAWLAWYDRNVEEIGSPVWGWSAENAVANSNHLSGTAIDVNAPKYPWGQRVMPAARIAKIREGLKLFEGSVFWGADWSRADEMHYQMAWPEGDKRNEAFAAKLKAGYLGIYKTAPTTTPGVPVALTDSQRIKDVRDQLCGPGDAYKGWDQLGGKTFVDALANLGVVVRRIAAKEGVDYTEINGWKSK